MKGLLLTDMELVPSVKKDNARIYHYGATIGDPTRQNQALILALHKGELKEYPQIGCGISDMLQDNEPAVLAQPYPRTAGDGRTKGERHKADTEKYRH